MRHRDPQGKYIAQEAALSTWLSHVRAVDHA